jgi:hypothetical protein
MPLQHAVPQKFSLPSYESFGKKGECEREDNRFSKRLRPSHNTTLSLNEPFSLMWFSGWVREGAFGTKAALPQNHSSGFLVCPFRQR